jgi:hypothetical protein
MLECRKAREGEVTYRKLELRVVKRNLLPSSGLRLEYFSSILRLQESLIMRFFNRDRLLPPVFKLFFLPRLCFSLAEFLACLSLEPGLLGRG